MNPRIALLIAAAIGSLILTAAPAEARRHIATHPNGFAPALDAAAVPAYPANEARKGPRHRGRAVTRRRPVVLASLAPSDVSQPALEAPAASPPVPGTIQAYAVQPEPEIEPAEAAGRGLIKIDVAGGHRITVSRGLSGPIRLLIAALYANGYRYDRITCAAAGGHVSDSNHYGGDACDFRGRRAPPAKLVRVFNLRSGCDFAVGRAGHRHADCPHVDNARNVGGVAFWNHVKHGGPRATRLASGHHHRRVRIARQ